MGLYYLQYLLQSLMQLGEFRDADFFKLFDLLVGQIEMPLLCEELEAFPRTCEVLLDRPRNRFGSNRHVRGPCVYHLLILVGVVDRWGWRFWWAVLLGSLDVKVCPRVTLLLQLRLDEVYGPIVIWL